ncbi:hypothetical protein QG37_01849 [Candidozyma auris]|nr:hypothetical protein QG37_01849 [[Candida] auris]
MTVELILGSLIRLLIAVSKCGASKSTGTSYMGTQESPKIDRFDKIGDGSSLGVIGRGKIDGAKAWSQLYFSRCSTEATYASYDAVTGNFVICFVTNYKSMK